MTKKKITDIFQEKVIERKERNQYGEWESVEKSYREKRPVDCLLFPLRVVNYFVDIFTMVLIEVSIESFVIISRPGGFDFLFIVIYFVYYILFESLFQKTVGKYFTGSLVVNEYGERPGFKTICLRTLSRIVPFEPFSTFLNDDAGFWHDRWTKTFVISKDELSLINRIQAGEKPKKSDEGKWDEWNNWQQ